MKKIFTYILLLSLISCNDSGVSKIPLSGNEENVPEEIKGIKVFKVALSDGDFIKVVVLENDLDKSISTKSSNKNTILIAKKKYKIISENDSILVLKKF